MTQYSVQPLALDRPIGQIESAGGRVLIYPTMDYMRGFNALLARTGGADGNLIQAALEAARAAGAAAQTVPAAAVAAQAAGAPASYALDPAAPISVAPTSSDLALVSVAAHTRTPQGQPPISLAAAEVEIPRGLAVTIYYLDLADTGGAVDYLYTADAGTAANYAGGARIVGSAFSAPYVAPFGSKGDKYDRDGGLIP
jgi:hypothetical protein